jgi:hypothetical protein
MISKINLKIVIIFMLLFLIIFRKNNFELFTDSPDITKIINNEYKADYDAINNLSEIAYQLQKEGMIVPSDLIINGKLKLPKDGTIYRRLTDNKLQEIKLNDMLIHNDEIVIKTSHGILKPKKDIKLNKYFSSADKKISKLDKDVLYNIEKVSNDKLENTFAPLNGC